MSPFRSDTLMIVTMHVITPSQRIYPIIPAYYVPCPLHENEDNSRQGNRQRIERQSSQDKGQNKKIIKESKDNHHKTRQKQRQG
jgi:hypothetical protein